ncbi:hypothetical protein CDD81_3052 [Ophiocordyceps australis]|uniref:Protoporphyrinogen oxidase n=1 Tax=Ophiocordyceps australis TaxID=1399860 RepID=A0A2C5YI34_9HYPO|nr:hypothetical protein CDD81_3052 [Ophiocordyceps australis]
MALRLGQRARQATSGARHYGTDSSGPHVGIIGGGLTGLTTAYYLAKRLPRTTRLTVYEASDRLGGWLQTERVEGSGMGLEVGRELEGARIAFERGPRTLTSLRETTWRLDDLVLWDVAHGVGLEVVSPADQARHVCYGDKLVKLPDAQGGYGRLAHPLFLGLAGAALHYGLGRLLHGRPRMPADDVSIAAWLRQLTGSDAVADRLASAMVHGIYGGDVDRLSARWVLEGAFVSTYMGRPPPGCCFMPAHEADLLADLAPLPHVARLASRPHASLLHFGAAGIEALPQALARALHAHPNVQVRTGCRVDAIRRHESQQHLTLSLAGAKGQRQSQHHHRVVAALDAASLLRASATELPSLAAAPSVSIMTVNLWYPQPQLNPRGFGYLIPRCQEPTNPERALGVFFDSDVGLAGPAVGEPPATKLFVLLGGHYYGGDESRGQVQPPSAPQAVAQAKAVLERHLAIPRHTPCFAMARPAWNCIPQHTLGHGQRMRTAHHELHAAFGGRLTVAGGSYSRIGVMGALRAGYDAARRITDSAAATGLERFVDPDPLANIVAVPKSKLAPVRALKP